MEVCLRSTLETVAVEADVAVVMAVIGIKVVEEHRPKPMLPIPWTMDNKNQN
jgi:hypothetical protein